MRRVLVRLLVGSLSAVLCVALPGGGAQAAATAASAVQPCPSSVALHDYQEPGGQLLHVGAPSCPLGPANWRLLDVPFTTAYVQPNAQGSAARPEVDAPGARIILPADYLEHRSKRYPVLYLLHGANDTYRSWTAADADGLADKGKAYTDVTANAAADSGLIVVMPSGSALGFYTDWAGATEANRRPMYESQHIRQLVPWVDANFRTWASKQGRAVAGLSMGGYGALMYAKRYPALFGTVASFSGTTDIEDKGYGPFPRVSAGRILQLGLLTIGSGGPENIFGPSFNPFTAEGTGPNWRAHNPMRDPQQYRGLDLTVFTGANDLRAPRTSRDRCELRQGTIGVAIGEAIFESAICVANEKFDSTVRASGAVPPASYWYQEFPGRLHNYTAWNEFLSRWLPRLMTKLRPAGSV